ncbi:hypothetical protein ACU4GA_10100 [Methylobacterium oryzae CBMB20]
MAEPVASGSARTAMRRPVSSIVTEKSNRRSRSAVIDTAAMARSARPSGDRREQGRQVVDADVRRPDAELPRDGVPEIDAEPAQPARPRP